MFKCICMNSCSVFLLKQRSWRDTDMTRGRGADTPTNRVHRIVWPSCKWWATADVIIIIIIIVSSFICSWTTSHKTRKQNNSTGQHGRMYIITYYPTIFQIGHLRILHHTGSWLVKSTIELRLVGRVQSYCPCPCMHEYVITDKCNKRIINNRWLVSELYVNNNF